MLILSFENEQWHKVLNPITQKNPKQKNPQTQNQPKSKNPQNLFSSQRPFCKLTHENANSYLE